MEIVFLKTVHKFSKFGIITNFKVVLPFYFISWQCGSHKDVCTCLFCNLNTSPSVWNNTYPSLYWAKVLRILEGDMVVDANYASTPGYDIGNRSGRMWLDQQRQKHSGPISSEATERLSGKLSLEALRAALWERDKATRRTSNEDDF